MTLWKFIVPKEDAGPGWGFLAIVSAETQEDARQFLAKYHAREGLPNAWVHVADVTKIPEDKPGVMAWTMAT